MITNMIFQRQIECRRVHFRLQQNHPNEVYVLDEVAKKIRKENDEIIIVKKITFSS